MLVLSRKVGESVAIGDDIVVTVQGVKGGKISLGISAPKSVSIRRSELEPTSNSNTESERGETSIKKGGGSTNRRAVRNGRR